MSFADADDVMAVIGEAVLDAAEAVTGTRPGPVSRMTWHEAQERYGSDKPDVRFGLELVDLGEVFAATEFKAFQADVGEGHPRSPVRATCQRAQLDKLVDRAKQLGAAGPGVDAGRSTAARSSARCSSSCPRPSSSGIVDTIGRRARRPAPGRRGDAPPRRPRARHAAGRARASAGARGRPAVPLGRRLPAVRGARRRRPPDPGPPPVHACPTPTTSSCSSTATGEDLLAVRSLAYDLVLNGWELGSGSRANPPARPAAADLLVARHRSDEEAQSRFGFLLDAFRFGAPPHAGFAFGIDRLTAILAGRGEHPRGHRVPQDPVGRRPPHRRAHPDRRGPAPRARPQRPPPTQEVASATRRSAPPRSVAQGGGGYGRAGRSGGFGRAGRSGGFGRPAPRCV